MQQPGSPRRWAFTPQPSKRRAARKRDTMDQKKREKRPRPTREGDQTRQEQTVDGMEKGRSRSRERRLMLTEAETKKPFPENDNWVLSQEHDSTFKLLWRCSQLDFPPTRTRLNLKLAAALVSTRCSHLFTKSFITELTQQQSIVLLQQPRCYSQFEK